MPGRKYATRERMPSADELVVEWPGEAFARIRPDRDTAVVVLTHDEKFDIPALAAALRTRGVLRRCARQPPRAGEAPRAARRGRADRRTSSHGCEGPAGLDIGAESPAETAVSILAEALALRAGRLGGPLREAPGRIHVER